MLNSETPAISNLAIRNVEPAIKDALPLRAARNGRSMEAELRSILKDALRDEVAPEAGGLASAIRKQFAPLGGVELPEHPPVTPRPAAFE